MAEPARKSEPLVVGAYRAHLFFDGIYPVQLSELTHARGDEQRAAAIARAGRGPIGIDVNCFGLERPDGLVLVDTGAGDDWGPDYGRTAEALGQAGFSPDDITQILLTHIHGDHTLGLLNREAARFPNAVVRLPAGDFAYYGDDANFAATPEGANGGFYTLKRLKRAYGERLKPVETGPVLPGIEALPLPGHTPGHTGYLVGRGRDSLFLWGDVIHVERLQPADPSIGVDADLDSVSALHSRQNALETAAREGWLIGGSHVRGFRRVERGKQGFVLRP